MFTPDHREQEQRADESKHDPRRGCPHGKDRPATPLAVSQSTAPRRTIVRQRSRLRNREAAGWRPTFNHAMHRPKKTPPSARGRRRTKIRILRAPTERLYEGAAATAH